MSDEARELVAPFKLIDGQRIVEKGTLQLEKNLNDDYVKFFELTCRLILKQSLGVVGLITNHAFQDNPTFRGFRWNLLHVFSEIYILDLHGNSKKKEQVPEGQLNENVFEIQQGVAISILLRRPSKIKLGMVALAEQWGTRDEKYQSLNLRRIEYRPVACTAPWFKMSAQDVGLAAEFGSYFSLADAMPLTSTGIKTHRDAFVLDFDKEVLRERVAKFRGNLTNEAISEELGLQDTHGWKLNSSRQRIRSRSDWEDAFQLCLYRPLDIRHIYYHADLVELPRSDCMQHLVGGENLALLATRQVTSPPFNHVTVTRLVNEMKTCSHDRGKNCFPLYLNEANLKFSTGVRRVNFSPAFLRAISTALKIHQFQPNGIPYGLIAENILHYIYALFYSPSYRSRYAEFLKTEFPRVPLTSDQRLFRALAELGGELTAIHLFESAKLSQPIAGFVGHSDPEIERISYVNNTVWIDRAQTIGFTGVPEVIWNFHIGGYQVCEKWLKDRKGHILIANDKAHYQKVFVVISETIRVMGEIDEVIGKNGAQGVK